MLPSETSIWECTLPLPPSHSFKYSTSLSFSKKCIARVHVPWNISSTCAFVDGSLPDSFMLSWTQRPYTVKVATYQGSALNPAIPPTHTHQEFALPPLGPYQVLAAIAANGYGPRSCWSTIRPHKALLVSRAKFLRILQRPRERSMALMMLA